MKPEIIKVKVKMGNTEVELTLDEVRELQTILNDTFGRLPNPIWIVPNYVPPTVWPPVPFWTTSVSGTTLCINQGVEA
jgi:hypothetical protein